MSRPRNSCGDCVNGRCVMNCGPSTQISRERYDEAAALFARIRDINDEMRSVSTLAEKVALAQEQNRLIAQRRAILGVE